MRLPNWPVWPLVRYYFTSSSSLNSHCVCVCVSACVSMCLCVWLLIPHIILPLKFPPQLGSAVIRIIDSLSLSLSLSLFLLVSLSPCNSNIACVTNEQLCALDTPRMSQHTGKYKKKLQSNSRTRGHNQDKSFSRDSHSSMNLWILDSTLVTSAEDKTEVEDRRRVKESKRGKKHQGKSQRFTCKGQLAVPYWLQTWDLTWHCKGQEQKKEEGKRVKKPTTWEHKFEVLYLLAYFIPLRLVVRLFFASQVARKRQNFKLIAPLITKVFGSGPTIDTYSYVP